MDALRCLALALGVTTDALVFEDAARGPDEALRLPFEAIRTFSPEEKQIVKALLEGLILKHQARRWAAA